MPPPTPVILGYSEAAMFLRRSPAPGVTAVLSIHGPREHAVEFTASHRLDLTFDDAEVPAPGNADAQLRQWTRRRWAEQNGLNEVPPTTADAAAIIQFAERLRDTDGLLLCHCGGGMSRAPAAALICLAVWRGPGAEAACVAAVRAVRPGAVPHAGLIGLADEILSRNGALVRALTEPR